MGVGYFSKHLVFPGKDGAHFGGGEISMYLGLGGWLQVLAAQVNLGGVVLFIVSGEVHFFVHDLQQLDSDCMLTRPVCGRWQY